MLQTDYPWTRPLGVRREGGWYTCGWCHLEVKGDGIAVLMTTSDNLNPGKPMYEARHRNGVCEVRHYLFTKDSEGNNVYRYQLAEVEFVWQPNTSQITVKGFTPEGDLNIGVRDLATGKMDIPNTMRAFAEKCEEWYAGMNVKTCRHCEKGIHPNFAGVWLNEDESEECPENNDGEHSPMSH